MGISPPAKARQMGLGPIPVVGLAEARETARQCRAAVRQGRDPIDDRLMPKVAAHGAARATTFLQVADRYIAAHEAGWRNNRHKYSWRATLDTACEQIDNMPVATVATADVMRVLEPVWPTKSEKASRLRGRMESVLDHAAAHGWRSGENPARWRGHLARLTPAPGKIAKVEHHAAFAWSGIGACMVDLHSHPAVAARVLEFAML